MRRILTAALALIAIFVISACATLPTAEEPADTSVETTPLHGQDPYIRDLIAEEIGPDPLLPIIFGCESTGNPHEIRHRNPDGSLIRNPTSSASGYAQVLLQSHGTWIDQTGLDMHDDREYTRFVSILLDQQGYGAWYPSQHCWGPYRHLASVST